jgi:hypothetical protein
MCDGFGAIRARVGGPPAVPAGPRRAGVNATDPLNLVGVIAPGDTVPAVRTNVVTYVDALPVASGAGAADVAEASGVDAADDRAPEVPDGPEAFDVLVRGMSTGRGAPMSDEAFPLLMVDDLGATWRFYERLGFRCATSSRRRASRASSRWRAARRPSASVPAAPPTTTAAGTGCAPPGHPSSASPRTNGGANASPACATPDGRLVYLGAPV